MLTHKKGLLALSPIAVLLGVYLGGSLIAGNFYEIPIAVSFSCAAIYSILVIRKGSLRKSIDIFSRGAANADVMYMIWIFCLAGVFATAAKSMGAIDTCVAITLKYLPGQFIPAGIFLAACFISLSIGTSVGTIAALAPVVTEIAAQTSSSTAWLIAIVVGGAFFGDNLSFISDTTIAATQTQGCRMSDKFRTNLKIVLPAAIVTLCIYLFHHQTGSFQLSEEITRIEWIKILPYVLVIGLAVSGVNVLGVLLTGIISTDIIALATGSFGGMRVFSSIGEGLQGMYELIMVTLLAAGFMNCIREAGGFDYLIQIITSKIRGKRGAEFAIAGITAATNFCTANNTIAILTVGPIAKDLSSRYGISPRKSASIMDTISCFVQGILPYGIQVLMAAGLANISPVEIIPHLYYPFLIGLMVIISIVFEKKA